MPSRRVVGIFLTSSGSRGDHLLFRYPYDTEEKVTTCTKATPRNPYAVAITEDCQILRSFAGSSIVNGVLVGYSDTVLANLLAVKANLCGSKFEVKINDVIFVGHPMLLHPTVVHSQSASKREPPTIISFNVVLALQSPVSSEYISCYYDLTKKLSVVLRHEERRVGLLSRHKNDLWAIQDELAAMPEDSIDSPYALILKKSHLASQLKQIYDEICSRGVVQIYINKWIHVNWCLPQQIYKQSTVCHDKQKGQANSSEALMESLRPYHGLLLLIDENTLMESLPLDASPSLSRLLKVTSPYKNIQTLASDADVSLTQVCQLVTHLVYWNKATVIYPLCEANIYVLSPSVSTSVNSILAEKFQESFPGVSLPAVLADFSVPCPLGDHKDVLGLPQQQAQEVQIVTWLLRHRLLVQLHTYVYLTPPPDPHKTRVQPSSSSFLPLPLEDSTGKTSSTSDLLSVNSDESQSMSTLSAKSPSLDCLSDLGEELTRQPSIRATIDHMLLQLQAPDRLDKDLITYQPEDLKLLASLCPYFDGKHHLEEIMYNENIRRSQLLMILDKFRDILITCQHEDPQLPF